MSRLETPVRKNDNVVVTTGKDRGKRGRVLKVEPADNRLVVEGVNFISRHTKPNPGKNVKGGIAKREAALHASNVQVDLPRVRQAHAHRPPRPGRRAQGAHLPQVRGSGGQMTRLKERYLKDVVPGLKKEFGYENVMAIPKVEKVVVNMGLGEATQNVKLIDQGADEVGRVTGQKPVTTRAKKSIAAFKVRKGMPVGTMVTLRGDEMYEFLDRLMNIALPRVRDFKGVSTKGFDGRGNLHARPARPAAVPRDRLHEGRQGARHERLRGDDGQDRRGSAAAAAAPRDAVQD